METPLPLPVARSDVHQAERRCLSLLPELHAGRRARRAHSGSAAAPDLELRSDAGNAPAARRRPRRRGGHLLPLLHHYSTPGTGDRKPATARTDGAQATACSRTADVFIETPGETATPAVSAKPLTQRHRALVCSV